MRKRRVHKTSILATHTVYPVSRLTKPIIIWNTEPPKCVLGHYIFGDYCKICKGDYSEVWVRNPGPVEENDRQKT